MNTSRCVKSDTGVNGLNKVSIVFVALFIALMSGTVAAEVLLAKALLANEQHKVPAKPSPRIVALAPHLVEMLFTIGAGQHIVGTVDYADYPAEAKTIERVGGSYGIQIEKILALKPDLVFVWQSGNKTADIEQLERLGLKVIKSTPQDIEDVAKEGYERSANEQADKFLAKLAMLKAKYQHKKTVRAFYQLWSEPMMTVNKETKIHQLMSICQAQNVFADNPTQYPQISIENVMVASPELIIIPDEASVTPQPDIQWQNWPEIPAVKHNQFIHVNADLLHRFSTRMLLGVERMCLKLDAFRK